jgi:hypothetical protein
MYKQYHVKKGTNLILKYGHQQPVTKNTQRDWLLSQAVAAFPNYIAKKSEGQVTSIFNF